MLCHPERGDTSAVWVSKHRRLRCKRQAESAEWRGEIITRSVSEEPSLPAYASTTRRATTPSPLAGEGRVRGMPTIQSSPFHP